MLLKLISSVRTLSVCQTNVIYAGLKSWTGGIKYDGFKYFPRHPGEKDPPYEPTKLLMVQRVKPYKGTPRNLRKILCDLKLNGKAGEIAIVKNIPPMIIQLYKIKHLIKITPIRTPNGLPEDGDLSSGYLREDGEFLVSQRLKPDEERVRLTEEFQTDPARLEAEVKIKQSRDRWMNPW